MVLRLRFGEEVIVIWRKCRRGMTGESVTSKSLAKNQVFNKKFGGVGGAKSSNLGSSVELFMAMNLVNLSNIGHIHTFIHTCMYAPYGHTHSHKHNKYTLSCKCTRACTLELGKTIPVVPTLTNTPPNYPLPTNGPTAHKRRMI